MGHSVVELTGLCSPVTDCGTHLPVMGLGTFSWRLTALTRIVSFFRIVRRLHPDLILTHYAQGLWAWLAPLCGAPLAVNVMGGDVLFDEQGAPSSAERNATREVLRQSAVLLCKSPYLAEEAGRLVPEGRAVVCGWGTDETIFSPGASPRRGEHGLAEGDTLVFSPRGMHPIYRIETVIRAFAQARLPGRKVLLVSTHRADPDYERRMRALCGELGIRDQVVFLPPLGHREMASYYRASDMSISVPESDGLPQTFFESTACGTPLIMADLPNYNGLIRDGETALLAPEGSDALARTMERLAGDPQLGSGLVERAQAFRRAYDAESAQVLGRELERAARQASGAGPMVHVRQLGRIMVMLAAGRPIVSSAGQPVYETAREYFSAIFTDG